jgi:hypothetical protein
MGWTLEYVADMDPDVYDVLLAELRKAEQQQDGD